MIASALVSVLLANTYAYPVQPIAPAPGHSVPQNATAFGPLEEDARYPGRSIWLRLPPEIEPWRAITRVHVTSVFHADLTGSDDFHRAFGLAADDTSGLRAGSATVNVTPGSRSPERPWCLSRQPPLPSSAHRAAAPRHLRW